MSLPTVFDEVSFGLELETCYYNEKIARLPSLVQKFFAVELLGLCLSKISTVTWQVDPPENHSYKNWTIVSDGSIRCAQGKKINLGVNRVRGAQFLPVEIVTPVLKGRNGVQTFTDVFYHDLYNADTVYMVNSSQGLHINLSHPRIKEKQLVKWWAYFEPALLQIITPERREAIDRFARPIAKDRIGSAQIRSLFADVFKQSADMIKVFQHFDILYTGNPEKDYPFVLTATRKRTMPEGFYLAQRAGGDSFIFEVEREYIDDSDEPFLMYELNTGSKKEYVDEAKIPANEIRYRPLPSNRNLLVASKYKYSTIHLHKNRIEIRIQEGSMLHDFIYQWLLFCMLFVAAIVVVDNDPPVAQKQSVPNLVKQLLDFIQDGPTQAFILDQYKRNSSAGPVTYEFGSKIIPIDSLPTKLAPKIPTCDISILTKNLALMVLEKYYGPITDKLETEIAIKKYYINALHKLGISDQEDNLFVLIFRVYYARQILVENVSDYDKYRRCRNRIDQCTITEMMPLYDNRLNKRMIKAIIRQADRVYSGKEEDEE